MARNADYYLAHGYKYVDDLRLFLSREVDNSKPIQFNLPYWDYNLDWSVLLNALVWNKIAVSAFVYCYPAGSYFSCVIVPDCDDDVSCLIKECLADARVDYQRYNF